MRNILSILVACLLMACAPLIAPYDAQAYKNATDLKARSLAMVEQSDDPYAKHAQSVRQLLVDMDAAYEFAAGRPRNRISAQQWHLIRRSDGGLVGTFVDFWQAQPGGIRGFARNEARSEISIAFDYLICLEANKQKAAECGSSNP